MLFYGIDLHKRTIAIQTVDGEGTVVREAQSAAQHWVRDLLAPQGIDVRLGHAKYR